MDLSGWTLLETFGITFTTLQHLLQRSCHFLTSQGRILTYYSFKLKIRIILTGWRHDWEDEYCVGSNWAISITSSLLLPPPLTTPTPHASMSLPALKNTLDPEEVCKTLLKHSWLDFSCSRHYCMYLYVSGIMNIYEICITLWND